MGFSKLGDLAITPENGMEHRCWFSDVDFTSKMNILMRNTSVNHCIEIRFFPRKPYGNLVNQQSPVLPYFARSGRYEIYSLSTFLGVLGRFTSYVLA